ncbi:Uma2 family endonuclease [Aeromicrobium alkaliterrae]|uniref:Uma2 family endonuclease n=1 Tax=Aeromicrobium alkaliterrae TaxID=302168 RepID=A0ABN2JZP0_9ACTN
MTAMPTEASPGLPRGRSLTRDDLDAMPDDGHRYELIDGILIVSPAPRRVHQRASFRLSVLIDATLPSDLELLPAPFDVALTDDTVMQPDLVVARVIDFTERDLPVAPLLAVEVLSPSTRGIDLLLKKERLERAGCAHYWVVDPDAPSITAWALEKGSYREITRASGDEVLEVDEPVAFTAVPADLVRTSGS